MQLGNVRDMPFSKIWETSEVFDDLRHYERLKGKCGACEYKGVCGGCRARALAATGDYLAEEPYCAYVPRKVARKRVLDEIQSGFPLAHDPYTILAQRLHLTREQVLEAIESLRSDGSVRQICASLSSKKLGYSSTLCALSVTGDQGEIDRVAELVSAHPEVTHNYLRDASYNIWFTAIAPSSAHLEKLAAQIAEETGCGEILNLPVTTLYKIRVDFGNSGSGGKKGGGASGGMRDAASREAQSPRGAQDAQAVSQAGEGLRLDAQPFNASDPFDVALVRWAQSDVKGDYPFADAAELIAAQIGDPSVSEERVIRRLEEWKALGVVRRFGAFVQHRKLGYAFNGMTVWDVAQEEERRIGRAFAELPFVSHCYGRPRCPQWPYSLYAMVHAQTQQELEGYVARMKEICGAEPRVLLSTKEYKKTLPVFFAN